MKRYYERNRAKVRQQQAEYRARKGDNAERCRAYYAANREERIEATKDYARRNPEKIREQNAIKKARRRAMPFTPEALEYVQIILADPCAYCGGPGGTVDHIVALADGGDGEWDNLGGACLSCNTSKKATPMLIWMVR